ncbi:MAG: YtrH family sporulation protein [Bacillota bacterium]|nr:YtrH family sporulation protein [Bacillota bacterium]
MALFPELALAFLVSAGVVLGGSLLGSFAGLLGGALPLTTMRELALRLKIWGVVAAMGGTLATLESLDQGLLRGQLLPLFRQGLFLLSAFAGADLAQLLIFHLTGPEPPP